MKRTEEITKLAKEILLDLSEQRSPLHVSILKASRLSHLLDMPSNVQLFQGWSEDAQTMEFFVGSFQSRIDAAKDPNISYGGPNLYYTPHRNNVERSQITSTAEAKVRALAMYKAKTYNFAMGIYIRWQFGNIAESVFEKKRKRSTYKPSKNISQPNRK